MKSIIPLRYLIPLTHISVFLFTAIFVGFSTYSLTKEVFEKKTIEKPTPQISQKADAEEKEEYLVYESRKVETPRSNGFNIEKVTGYARNIETGEEHIVYSFLDDPYNARFRGTVPTSTLLKNGTIFINGVSDYGYAILDLVGNNLTKDYYKILRNRDFPLSNILFKNEKEIFMTYGGVNTREGDDRHKIYWKQETGPLKPIDASTFPSGDIWLRPIGWSSKSNEFYVERQSNATTYAQIWRINDQVGNATALQSIKGAITTGVRVCPEQDFAVYVSAALNPSVAGYGEQIGPSRLMVSNLATDSSQQIYSSKALLTDFVVSCKTKKIIVNEAGNFRLFDITGKQLSHNHFSGTPVFFADNGKTVILKNAAGKILLANIQNGKHITLGGDEASPSEIHYILLGLSGF